MPPDGDARSGGPKIGCMVGLITVGIVLVIAVFLFYVLSGAGPPSDTGDVGG